MRVKRYDWIHSPSLRQHNNDNKVWHALDSDLLEINYKVFVITIETDSCVVLCRVLVYQWCVYECVKTVWCGAAGPGPGSWSVMSMSRLHTVTTLSTLFCFDTTLDTLTLNIDHSIRNCYEIIRCFALPKYLTLT